MLKRIGGFICFLVVVLAAVGASAQTAAAPSDDKIWADYVAWLKDLPPTKEVISVIQLYSKELAVRGATPEVAKATMGRLLGLMRERPDAWRLIFNRIYTTEGATFKVEPSAVVVGAVEGRKPGRALDVGMGQGRNSVFLAIKGWDVTGIDLSDAGLAAAQAQATRAGTSVKTEQADASRFDYGVSQWDLIVVTYGPGFLSEPPFTAKLQQALRPGGLLVIESFASSRTDVARRPVDVDPASLLAQYSAFRIVRFEDVDAVSEWDPQPSHLVRFVGQKRP